MDNKIEIIPLKGIIINDKEINFLDSKEKIIKLLGVPEYKQKSVNGKVVQYYYLGSELRLDFNCEDKSLEFIEFLGGYKAKINPILYGTGIFSTYADDLVNIIKENDNGPIHEKEGETSRVFFDTSIGLWRELTPTIYENEIKNSDYSEEEIAEFKKRTMYWETVGIGNKGYYNYLND